MPQQPTIFERTPKNVLRGHQLSASYDNIPAQYWSTQPFSLFDNEAKFYWVSDNIHDTLYHCRMNPIIIIGYCLFEVETNLKKVAMLLNIVDSPVVACSYININYYALNSLML